MFEHDLSGTACDVVVYNCFPIVFLLLCRLFSYCVCGCAFFFKLKEFRRNWGEDIRCNQFGWMCEGLPPLATKCKNTSKQ